MYKTKKKLCFVFGTRPEIIKLSPLIKLCEKKKISFFCIHTGQHYSSKLGRTFLEALKIPEPRYRLKIKSKAPYRQGDHTGRMLIKIEEVLLKELPYCMICQGDTNSALAGLLTAEKITTTKKFTGYDIKTAHVEAGLRCFDRTLPEEVNRVIIDHFSDLLFVPTKIEKQYLLNEGIPREKIYITGNTIVDVIKKALPGIKSKSQIAKRLNLGINNYILLTLHRQENVNSPGVLKEIIKGVHCVGKELKLPIYFPLHPRTKHVIDLFKISVPNTIQMIPPAGYFDFLWLQANAALVLTDSGGIQEEACILHVPCVTLRDSTERPQTELIYSNVVAGTKSETIYKAAIKMFTSDRKWNQPYGDGKTSERIVDIIMNERG